MKRVLSKRKNNFFKDLGKSDTKKFFARGEMEQNKNEIRRIIPV
jgi:hypothetical protein